jgi:hypothetical protein
MFLLATTLVALAVLFFLTTLALAAAERAPHPLRLAVALAAVLTLGLVLLLE